MDLFATPVLARDIFASRRLSIVPVIGDQVMPTLRGWWDYVLAAPCKAFSHDGLYVLDLETGGPPLVYRCQRILCGGVRLFEQGGSQDVDLDWFNEHVLGIVVCDLKVRDHDMMRQAWEAGR